MLDTCWHFSWMFCPWSFKAWQINPTCCRGLAKSQKKLLYTSNPICFWPVEYILRASWVVTSRFVNPRTTQALMTCLLTLSACIKSHMYKALQTHPSTVTSHCLLGEVFDDFNFNPNMVAVLFICSPLVLYVHLFLGSAAAVQSHPRRWPGKFPEIKLQVLTLVANIVLGW